jgi:tetratricopeptide (TPR) repeat protein
MRLESLKGSFMFSPRFRSILFAAPVIVFAVSHLQAQTPSWPITGQAFAAAPADIQSAAASIQAEPFMETTVLLESDSYSFDAEGRLNYRHHLIYRLETKEAIDDWDEISSRWSPWYQNQPEIHARVISPDGKVTNLDQKTITDGPAKEESEDTYTDDRVRKVPLPAIAVGAIVEEETVSSDKQPFFAGGGVYDDSFSRSVPIVRAELTVDAPAATNFRYKLIAFPQAQVKNEVSGGTRHFSMVQGYLPGQADSDIDLPTHILTGPLVEFSTGESWATVAGDYQKLAEVNIDPAKVKSMLPKPGANRMETIALIVAQLHKSVRYTGIEFGESSLQPVTAAEILKRHYGDCKDKAALLVALLRAAGIDANMALLDSGPGNDLDPELPGMNLFDHAIVYVPPAQGADALWIDATAEYTGVGSLPSMDEGRQALIIADGTTALTLTPTPRPDDDRLIELREVQLAEYGPAHVVETSMTNGDIDDSYRSLYGGQMSRDTREDLEKYAKNVYMAKALADVSHGDAHDMDQPFALKLEMTEARRADTAVDEAVLGIPYADIFDRLPEWFRTDPKTEGEKLTPQQEENRKRAIAARTPEYDVHPFATEWRYTITPPEGYTVRALPDDKTIAMGPATFKQHYEADAAGKIVATYRFETVKPRFTIDEALALRDAVLATYKEDMLSIWFDQTGSKLLDAGKIREALAADRKLIAAHPTESIHHAQIAYVFLKAGLGGKARSEAEEATRLDPKSVAAFRTLGWVCQFNEIGVQFEQGFDLDCAANALKKALALDPDDSDIAVAVAGLEEYDAQGERYTPGAHLNDAIATLKALKDKDKSESEKYEDNLLFDLLYSGHYAELLAELDKFQTSTTRSGLGISATVALQGGAKGVAAGIKRADELSTNSEGRSAALATSGNQLMRMRLYAEAADVLSAAVTGQQDSAGTTQQITLLRKLTPWKNEFLPPGDPRSPVQRILISLFAGTVTESQANEVLARHAYGSEDEWRTNLKNLEEAGEMLRVAAARDELPSAVLLDVLTSSLKLTAEGSDETGYRITVESLGAKPRQLFVTREDGAYRAVTSGDMPAESGNEVLYLLANARDKEAQSLLDWMRDRLKRGGGDDPLSGPLFPRFWSQGDAADREKMKLAAEALIADTPTIKSMLPDLRAAWEKTPAGDARLNLSLLLAHGYTATEDGPRVKEVAQEILTGAPDSNTAVELMGGADELLKDWDGWREMLDAHLAKHPGDETLLRMKARYEEAHGEWADARATLQKLVDQGEASANDYNMYAWSGLFDNSVNDDTLKAGRQATMLTNNASFAELHTLACLYAAHGETSESRDLLLKAMAAANLTLPNSEVWFGFGSLYQQYGVDDAAIAAYEKVEKPTGYIHAGDTYLLAQARLKELKQSQQ